MPFGEGVLRPPLLLGARGKEDLSPRSGDVLGRFLPRVAEPGRGVTGAGGVDTCATLPRFVEDLFPRPGDVLGGLAGRLAEPGEGMIGA